MPIAELGPALCAPRANRLGILVIVGCLLLGCDERPRTAQASTTSSAPGGQVVRSSGKRFELVGGLVPPRPPQTGEGFHITSAPPPVQQGHSFQVSATNANGGL